MSSFLTTRQAQQAFTARFLLDWPAPALAIMGAAVPVFVENKQYNEPTSGAWCSIALRELDSATHTLGSKGRRQQRRDCMAWVQLRLPAGDGVRLASDLADLVSKLFERKALDGIDYGTVRKNQLGVVDSRWYRVTVTVEAVFYEMV